MSANSLQKGDVFKYVSFCGTKQGGVFLVTKMVMGGAHATLLEGKWRECKPGVSLQFQRLTPQGGVREDWPPEKWSDEVCRKMALYELTGDVS